MKPLYDSLNGYVYIPSQNLNTTKDTVTVVSGTNNSVVSLVKVGYAPGTPTVDPDTGAVFVPNSDGNTVSVLSGLNNSVVTTITMGDGPLQPFFDPDTGDLYVVAQASDHIAVISGTNYTQVASIPVGDDPEVPAYDPSNGFLYVTNTLGNSVTVVSTTNNSVVATISTIGEWPLAALYVPSNGEVYVPNDIGGGLTVISTATDALTAYIPVGDELFRPTFDTDNGLIYVTDGGSSSQHLYAISPTANEVEDDIQVGFGPKTPTFDSPSGDLFVSNFFSDTVSIVEANSVPLLCTTAAASPTVGPEPLLVSFTSGVSGGEPPYNWSWSFGDGATATTADPGHTYAEAGSYSVTLNVTDSSANSTGATLTIDVQATYPVTFTESGLPVGTSWQVNVTGEPTETSTTSMTTLSLPNGSYAYGVPLTSVSGGRKAYDAPGGSFVVNGARVSEALAFVLVQRVTFSEKALPAGAEWWVNVSGGASANGTGPVLWTWEPRGTYTYTVGTTNKEYSAKGGTFTVKASGVARTVKFKLVTYGVTFTESGLPSGARWCVAVALAKSHCTTKTSLSFLEPNGTYYFSLTTSKKAYTGSGGVFTVDGAAVSLSAAYSALYPIGVSFVLAEAEVVNSTTTPSAGGCTTPNLGTSEAPTVLTNGAATPICLSTSSAGYAQGDTMYVLEISWNRSAPSATPFKVQVLLGVTPGANDLSVTSYLKTSNAITTSEQAIYAVDLSQSGDTSVTQFSALVTQL